MHDEDVQLICDAMMSINGKIESLEVVQQLMCMHLNGLSPELAETMASNFENIANSDDVDKSDYVAARLRHAAKFLRGDTSAEVVGLYQPRAESSVDPRHWFRGVIDGGKPNDP